MALEESQDGLEQALADLVMNCRELTELERRLSQFNIFRVLRADRHEIRHSNMLAWLSDPDGSHGFGDRFLRRWLMRVVHDAISEQQTLLALPSPIEIDALDIEYVEVARESENIDLLVLIHPLKDLLWVLCVENKVESVQRKGQLRGYREVIERRYPDAGKRLFLFLTKYDEMPEDSGFLTSSYSVIQEVLEACLEERGDSIGSDPRLLIKHYLELLTEDFVEENRSISLARQIYLRHKKALDFILDNRVDPISEGSDALKEKLELNADQLGIVMAPCNKGRLRFLPKEWDVPENRGGTAWGPGSRYIVCEVTFWNQKVELHIQVGKAPEDLANRIWERAARTPFRQETKERPKAWIMPFRTRSAIKVQDLADAERDIGADLFNWVHGELEKPSFKEAKACIQDLLKARHEV
jgi:hypothetical protein